jgi:nucleotide-binding universal stress UspA family protein
VETEVTVPIGSPVLVPFDGSRNAEAVLPYVPWLAGDGREVILLQVIPEAETLRSPLGEVMVSAEEIGKASLAVAHDDLRRATEALAKLEPDMRVEQVVESGDPSERIIEVARERQVRSIVLSSQGRSATGPGGFGSVVGRVARTAPVPVVVVRPNGEVGAKAVLNRLVVAHDGSPRAALALPVAQHLARHLATPVHVVAVVEDEEAALPAAVASYLAPHVLDEAHADALNVARQRVETVGASLLRQGLSSSWEVLAGPAAASIIGACGPRDVLVITSHGKSGSRWMLGSTAEKLVRESPVPVVLLRTPPATEGQAT